MKKTLYVVFIFSLLLGSFNFVSAGPSLKPGTSPIGGVIDGESVIKEPIIDEIDTMPRPCKADDYQEVRSVCRNSKLTVSFVKKEGVRCAGKDIFRFYRRGCHSIVRPPIGGTDGVEGIEIDKPIIIEIDPKPICTADDYKYTNWGLCQVGVNKRYRNYVKKSGSDCIGTVEPTLPLEEACHSIVRPPIGGTDEIEGIEIDKPIIIEIDSTPKCIENDYQEVRSACINNKLTVSFVKKEGVECEDGYTPPAPREMGCHSIVRPPIGGTDGVEKIEIDKPIIKIDPKPICTADDYKYTDWGLCQVGVNKRYRNYVKKSDSMCTGTVEPTLPLEEACEYSGGDTDGNTGGNTGGGNGGNTGGGSGIGGGVLLPSNPTVTNPIQQVLGEKVTAVKYIKTPNSSTVYLLDDKNVRHAYPHEKIWYSYFDKDFSFVETITEKELATYPLGRNVTFKAGILMKIPSVPKVYKVADDNGTIQWIKTEEAAIRLYGEDWKNLVKDLSEAFFEDYTLGEDIE
jgi:hypothetical protein